MDPQTIPVGPPPLPCIHCGRNLTAGEDFQYAVILYGVFFLLGKHDGYIGTTCPSCVKTTYSRFPQDGFDSIVDICLDFDFRGLTHQEPLKYFSPYVSSPENTAELCGYFTDIFSYVLDDDGDIEIALNEMSTREVNHLPDLYRTYIENIGPSIGPYFYNLWLTDYQLQKVLLFEDRSGLSILPRYVFNSELLKKIDKFSWLYKYRDIHFKPAIDFVTKHDSLQTVENSDLYITPELHEILTMTPTPWIGASRNDSEFVSIWKKSAPFGDVPPSAPFEEAIVKESIVLDLDHKIYDSLKESSNKEYSKQFILDTAYSFINDYFSIVKRQNWSYSQLRHLINRYTAEYYNAVKNGLRKEAKYSFYKIGNSFKIRFNNKELPEASGVGFEYIHYLVCNSDRSFKHDELKNLTSRNIDICSMKKYNKIESDLYHEEFDFDNKELFNEYDIIDGSDTFEISDEKSYKTTLNEIKRLNNDIELAVKSGDLDKIIPLKNEINKIDKFKDESFEKGGNVKIQRGDYVKIQNKIGKSIKEAIDWMINQGFDEAYQHFKRSIKPYANKVQYVSSDSSIEWHT